MAMSNWYELSEEGRIWRALVHAAKKGATEAGYTLTRLPGRGLANVWQVQKNGKSQIAAIRTTRDRAIAFPPLDGGKNWKTLDDVDLVIVAATDSKKNPKTVDVYILPAAEVRKRFDASYKARIEAGHKVSDNYGMWLFLDNDPRPTPARIGSGIIEEYERIASYPMDALMAEAKTLVWSNGDEADAPVEAEEVETITIAEVLDVARQHIARIAGVKPEAVKLDLKVEY